MTHWAIKYIGKEWQKGAAGPEAFDCWGLVRAVHAERFQNALPLIEPDRYAVLELVRTFGDSEERKLNWVEVPTPREGDVVLLGRAKHVIHAGVYVEVDGGGVLHSLQPATASSRNGGVVFQKLNMLESAGWGHVSFVRHRSMLEC